MPGPGYPPGPGCPSPDARARMRGPGCPGPDARAGMPGPGCPEASGPRGNSAMRAPRSPKEPRAGRARPVSARAVSLRLGSRNDGPARKRPIRVGCRQGPSRRRSPSLFPPRASAPCAVVYNPWSESAAGTGRRRLPSSQAILCMPAPCTDGTRPSLRGEAAAPATAAREPGLLGRHPRARSGRRRRQAIWVEVVA